MKRSTNGGGENSPKLEGEDDFYELFFDDALIASRELELTLTGKECGLDERAPMCGIPYHSCENYIARLVKKGYKVAICEQMEDPATAKGLVKRDIIRVVTPGTVIDAACLEEKASNFLCGIYIDSQNAGAAFCDISTGKTHLTAFDGPERVEHVINELGRFSPAEAVVNDGAASEKALTDALTEKFRCRVENDGAMKNNKGVNVPGIRLSMPYMSQRDREDILFGAEQGFDFVAASFVRTAADVREIRSLLDSVNSKIRIIAKIENQEGVSNLAEILSVADGIMVARGDMGVEIDFTEIPIIQKNMIAQCVACGKPVITATQMLDSMMENPRPTRAEITDVANAIYDGTSAIMLSGETAAGKYPVEAVHTMDAIARRTEANIDFNKPVRKSGRAKLSITAATAHAACTTALDIGADAILTVSQRGITAQMVSSFRPSTMVVALLLNPQVQRQMALYWGVEPITMPYASSTDELVDFAVQAAEASGLVSQGDLVVVTAGVPVGVSGTTNMIRVQQVGGALLNAVGVGDRKASGPLCVCRVPEEVAEKFRPGDVLVVPYTTNDLLPYIRQAAAVISEEASADSHTATVGLTLDIPVIVGAVGATQRLADGTMVSVDCARGVVQTLPQ